MAELDVDVRRKFRRALADALVGWEDVDGNDLRGSQTMFAGILHRLEPFIAALEDRDRLRAAAQEVWDSIPGSFDPADPVVRRHSRALTDLGAVLDEGRDG